MTFVQKLKYYPEQEKIEEKNKNRLIPEEEYEEEEKEDDEIKQEKNKKVKIEEYTKMKKILMKRLELK